MTDAEYNRQLDEMMARQKKLDDWWNTGNRTSSAVDAAMKEQDAINKWYKDNDYYASEGGPSYRGTDSGGSSGGYSDPYGGSSSSLAAQLAAAQRAQEEAAAQRRAAYESALRSQYNTSLGALGQSAAGANTGEYVRYMQNQTKLPQQAALMGTGGLSESSLMGLNAAYGTNLNNIEQERARGQSSLENQLNQGIAQGEGQYADTMAGIQGDYASKLLTLTMQEQANELARQQALQAQSNWEKEFAANQAQLGVTNTLNAQKQAASTSKSSSGGGTSTGSAAASSTPTYGGNTTNASWNNMVNAVTKGNIPKSILMSDRANLVAQYGIDGFNALYSIAK